MDPVRAAISGEPCAHSSEVQAGHLGKDGFLNSSVDSTRGLCRNFYAFDYDAKLFLRRCWVLFHIVSFLCTLYL